MQYFHKRSRPNTNAKKILATVIVVSLLSAIGCAQTNNKTSTSSSTSTPVAPPVVQVSTVVPSIPPLNAKNLFDAGGNVVFVDVRDRSSYDRSHIPGALSVPLSQLEDRVSEIAIGFKVVVYAQCT